MKVFLGILFLMAGLAGGAAVLTSEEQGTEFMGIVAIFGAGVGYGLLAASKR